LPPCDARLPRSRRHAVLSQVVHLGEPSAALIVAEC
jgi:hypothetical protein